MRLPPALLLLKLACTASSWVSTRESCSGSFTSQVRWGWSRTRAPLAPPRLSEPRKLEAEAQAVATNSGTVRPVARICCFKAARSAPSTKGWSMAGRGSCQIISSAGTSGPR